MGFILKNLKNKYKGERIFILGTGPSLNDIPLEDLQDEYTFGIHRIGMIYDSTPWRPDFYICATRRVAMSKEYNADVQKSIDLGIPSFIGTRISNSIKDAPNIIWITCRDIVDTFIAPPEDIYWDRDVGKGQVSIYGHVGRGAILLSIYMGFGPIYLGGMGDYLLTENRDVDINHFHPDYEGGRLSPLPQTVPMYRDKRRMAHEFTARKAAERGLQIFSLNKELAMYEQANLQEVLNG